MNIYVVRHGETEWNREGRLQGWLNSELTENGRTQAELLRKQLRISFDKVYSSPLKRAVDTANILTNNEQPIVRDARLKEIHLGSWQGRLISHIQQEDANRYAIYCQSPEQYIPDNGESLEQLKSRMNDFLQDCLQERVENVLVVTHGVSIRALLLAVNNWPIRKIWDVDEIDGTSVTKITVEENRMTVHYIGKKLQKVNSIE